MASTEPTLGGRLKATRIARGLTQRALALDANDYIERGSVSYAYVSRLEQGLRYPSVPVIRALALSLGVSAHWLETGTVEVAPDLLRRLVEGTRAEQAAAREEARAFLAYHAAVSNDPHPNGKETPP